METIRTFLRPVIDLQGTGAQIKRLRQLNGFSVHDLQLVFGFDYPQAIPENKDKTISFDENVEEILDYWLSRI